MLRSHLTQHGSCRYKQERMCYTTRPLQMFHLFWNVAYLCVFFLLRQQGHFKKGSEKSLLERKQDRHLNLVVYSLAFFCFSFQPIFISITSNSVGGCMTKTVEKQSGEIVRAWIRKCLAVLHPRAMNLDLKATPPLPRLGSMGFIINVHEIET